MRNYDALMDVHPTLIGSIDTTSAKTAVGAPIDTLGFKDMMATLVLGAASGTTTATGTLAVKLQESASATGTGGAWTDITDGAITGTLAFTTLTVTGTDPSMQMGKLYERLQEGTRARYIRAHATAGGTSGLGMKYCVQILLGRPNDTLYISDAVTQGTGNEQVLSNR